jgi:2-phospho-L-lactate guanylyltransferase
MQATVSAFDDRSRSGAVLCDDGVELPFGAAAFLASGLRTIRLGQRVGLDVDGDGRAVRALWLATIPRAGGTNPT